MRKQMRSGGAALAFGLAVAVCGLKHPAIGSATTPVDIARATGVDRGLALVIAEDARLACDLADTGAWQVHLLVVRPELIDPATKMVHQRRLGGRVVVQPIRKDGKLPHPDRFVNLVVADRDRVGGVAPAELERVLAVRGASWLGKDGSWKAEAAKDNPRLDDWSHRFYDASGNCVSRDRIAAAPQAIQWQHGPAFEDGTADGKVPRIGDGRFVSFDNQTGDLVCRDASNGLLLWRRFVGSPQNADFAIVGGRIYLYLDESLKPGQDRRRQGEQGPLVALDLDTGKTAKTYAEALRAGGAAAVITLHHENTRTEKMTPVPWFIVRDDVIVQAYGPELVVLDRATGARRFTKKLDEGKTWFTPTLSGNLLIVAETVGTARRGRHDGATHVQAIAAFDLASGRAMWRNTDAHPLRKVNDRDKGPVFLRAEFMPLSVADGLVLIHVSSYQFRHGGRVAVLDASGGKELWHRDYQPGELYDQGSQRTILRGGEVAIMDGLGARTFDARTGEPKGPPIPLPKDQRRQARPNGACTSSRATLDWLICNAYLYVGPDGEVDSCFGARGACGQGVVPANGLMFVNPTPCDCGDYTRGAQAMAPRMPGSKIDDADRLVRGPKFDDLKNAKLAVPDSGWPMFLGDVQRRSATSAQLPEQLKVLWTETIARPRDDHIERDRQQSERDIGALSAPAAAADVVLVALPESHAVEARDPKTGKRLWSFATPGKVDSPPTIVVDRDKKRGLAIFGCEDGAVYAVTLDAGELAWKFHAAPTDGLAMSHGHLASATPLPGSVLVVGDTIFVSAGQHTDLGGLHLYALDAATGAVRARRVVGTEQPAVVTNDILVADASGDVWLGNGQSMLHLSRELADLPIEKTKVGGAANRPPLSFDRNGTRIRFRTDQGRGGSTHGWRGAVRTPFAQAHRAAQDGDVSYVLRDPTSGERHSAAAGKSMIVRAGSAGMKTESWGTSSADLGVRESYGALIKAGDRIYIGGGARDGSKGFVQILDAATGRLRSTLDMPSRVAECGLAAADGRLFVTCEHGELVCLGE